MLQNVYEIFVNKFLKAYSNKLYRKYDYQYSSQTSERFQSVPSVLNSWQAVCLEKEVIADRIISKNIMGHHIVIWRDDRNKVSVLDAHCPHLGIHLGSGGKIIKGKIRCPFHHRIFSSAGVCTNKSKKDIFSYPVEINAGIVFVWFHSNKLTPTWNLPNIEEDLNGEIWGIENLSMKGIEVKSHPITYIENGVDYNHAIKLHGYRQNGTTMNVNKQFLSVFFKHSDERRGFINIKAYGPFVIDYHLTFTWWKNVEYRFLVLLQLTPEGTFVAHKIKMRKRISKLPWLVRLLHSGIFIYFEFKLLKNFMKEDHMIMINRKYLDEPDYDAKDNYIPGFRSWYKQFYSVADETKNI